MFEFERCGDVPQQYCGWPTGRQPVMRRVLIKCDKKVFLLKEQEIDFVEAAGNYVYVS
jgi:DNA-binding LytR/AlgR family response regulator